MMRSGTTIVEAAPFVLLGWLLLLVGCAVGGHEPVGGPDKGGVRVAYVEHRGFADCVELTAGPTRVVVVPQWAGRLSVVDFGGGNVLKTDPRIDGRALAADVPWMPWDGNATDLMRGSDRRSQWPGLWLHPYQVVQLGGDFIELRSRPSADTGLQVSKRYELAGDGLSLRYTVKITRLDGDAAEGWTIWERALMPVGRYALAPLRRGGAFPEGYTTRDGGTVAPADRVTVAGDYLVMRPGTTQGAGLAVQLAAGWLAAVADGGVLAMTFPLEPTGPYPHYDAATAIPWIGPDVIEMEPVAPQMHLKRGESASFTQVWRWLTPPSNLDLTQPAAVGRWIDGTVDF